MQYGYHDMIFLGGYYAWLAKRNFPMSGNRPTNGEPYTALNTLPIEREAAKAAHVALSAFWFTKAKEHRTA